MQVPGLKWGIWSLPAIDLTILCPASLPETHLAACPDGTWIWRRAGNTPFSGRYRWLPEQSLQILSGKSPIGCEPNPDVVTSEVAPRGSSGFELRVDFTDLTPGSLIWCFAARGAGFAGLSDWWPVGWGMAPVLGGDWLVVATGDERAAKLRLELHNGQIESSGGMIAGADLGFTAQAQLSRVEAGWDVTLQLALGQGEMLLGDVYLAPGNQPLRLTAQGRFDTAGTWAVERLVFTDPAGVELTGEAHGDSAGPAEIRLQIEPLDLASIQAGYLDGWLARSGWRGLVLRGRVAGRGHWRRGLGVDADFDLAGLEITDIAGRIGLEGFAATLAWRGDGQSPALNHARWDAFSLGALTFGGGELHGVAAAHSFALTAPLRMPLFDGALRLDRLAVNAPPGAEPVIGLAAKLESLDLAALSTALGWLPFAGRVAATLPGAHYHDGVLTLTGEIGFELFGGRVALSRLSVERPFSTLPALAGDLKIAHIDLEQLTSALPIGHMTGTLTGQLLNLRLLDWQPVAFDAWFGSVPGTGGRISQRAVDSISRLGGGNGINSLLLRLFETFPYRRFGLGCRLRQGVCLMRGIADTVTSDTLEPSESFVVIEGCGLPHLQVIGHERRVDWTRLLENLKRLISGELQTDAGQP